MGPLETERIFAASEGKMILILVTFDVLPELMCWLSAPS